MNPPAKMIQGKCTCQSQRKLSEGSQALISIPGPDIYPKMFFWRSTPPVMPTLKGKNKRVCQLQQTF